MPACSKIPTLMPMGRPSGSLFHHTSSLQMSICDLTMFRPDLTNSLTFSFCGEAFRIGLLLKRPNQHSFAICDKARFRLVCSNIKKKNNKKKKKKNIKIRTCKATIRTVSDLPVPISCTFMYNDGSAGSSLFVYTKL